MFGSTIDVGGPRFWVFFLAALVLIMPLRHAGLRWWAIAAVDLGFIAALAGVRAALLAFGLCGVVYLGSRATERPALRRATPWAMGLAGALLFFWHKTALGPAPFKQALAAVGFSYVTLRSIELMRAVNEGAQPSPSFVRTIAYLMPF